MSQRSMKTDYSNLRILMHNQDEYSCNMILKANILLQMGNQDDAYEII